MPDDCPFKSPEAAGEPSLDPGRRTTRAPCFSIAALVLSVGCLVVGAGIYSLGRHLATPGGLLFMLPVMGLAVTYLTGLSLTLLVASIGAMRSERAWLVRVLAMVLAAAPLVLWAVARQFPGMLPGATGVDRRAPYRRTASLMSRSRAAAPRG